MPLSVIKETPMNDDNLKDCPCCGGKARYSQITSLFNIPGDIREKIQCTSCGLTLEDSYGKAKVKWNTRIKQPTQLNSEDDEISCKDCFHYETCDRYPFNEDGCKHYYPGNEIAKLEKLKSEVIHEIIQSPIGESMMHLFDSIAEKIDEVTKLK